MTELYIGRNDISDISGLANMTIQRNINTSGFSAAGPLFQLNQLNSSDNKPVMVLNQAASSIPFIHFNGTSQGTGHTSIAESVAVRGPSGTTRYINLYS